MGKIKLLKSLTDGLFTQFANKYSGLTRRGLAKKIHSLGYGTSPHRLHKNQTPLSFKQNTQRIDQYFDRANEKGLIEKFNRANPVGKNLLSDNIKYLRTTNRSDLADKYTKQIAAGTKTEAYVNKYITGLRLKDKNPERAKELATGYRRTYKQKNPEAYALANEMSWLKRGKKYPYGITPEQQLFGQLIRSAVENPAGRMRLISRPSPAELAKVINKNSKEAYDDLLKKYRLKDTQVRDPVSGKFVERLVTLKTLPTFMEKNLGRGLGRGTYEKSIAPFRFRQFIRDHTLKDGSSLNQRLAKLRGDKQYDIFQIHHFDEGVAVNPYSSQVTLKIDNTKVTSKVSDYYVQRGLVESGDPTAVGKYKTIDNLDEIFTKDMENSLGGIQYYDETLGRVVGHQPTISRLVEGATKNVPGIGPKKIKQISDELYSKPEFTEDLYKHVAKDGGRVKLGMGGVVRDRDPREFSIEDLDSKVGTLQSMLAGIGSGLLDIPKGAFTLGAALMDMGFGTNNAAKVEKYFDDLTSWDEKAEATFAGNLTKIMINLGVPGGFAFKAGTSLATKAMLAKKHGNYFRLTDPKLVERYKTALNGKGRLFATLGGAGATGVSDMIFVGDPEHVGTIGDMFGGPTQLKPNDSDSASREVVNRMKFGLDTSLLVGAVGGLGSSIKSLVRRGNELESNNTAIDKFLSYIRPRGKKTAEYFEMERESLGLKRGDVSYASDVSRKLDKHIDKIFPFVKNPFNKMGNKGRREFMNDLNETLLSGDFNINAATGRAEFGNMNKGMVEKITKMMRDKGGKSEDIQGVMDSFYDIRLGWGHMFSRLGGAMDKEALKEFAPLFGKKLKDYLGSTYEIFQNKSLIPLLNYQPSSEAVEKMVKLFKTSATQKGVKLTDEEARHYVDKLVETARPARAIATKAERTSGVYFDAPDFFVNKTTLHDLEVAPRTLPLEALNKEAKPVVEELLGKISDPLQTVLAGTGKLSMITRRNQFFQTLKSADDNLTMKRKDFIAKNPGVELPPELRGMFRGTELEAVNELGKNIKKIEIDPRRIEEAGITHPLDGLYAERGVAEAIEESSMIAKDKSTLKQLYDSFILYPKATSQMAKTILSPITHARNFISAGAFATANGLIPGLTVSVDDTAKAWKEAYQALQIPGARMANDRYRDLLRLGVVNTNVRLGDLQKLLKDVDFGESWGSRKAMRGMMRQLSKAKKWTEDMYTAEDDFWKISSFALERSRLKNAYTKYGMKFTDDLLDKEAASIVKNNIPNYDMVNGFIKDLRQLPFGNFVSFPAEIYRTSFNIMNRALKEINLTHTLDDGRIVKPLRKIGMQRMFGLATTVVAMPYGTVEAAKAIYDVTEDEMQALRRFVPEWSKNSTLVPIRDDDGTMKYVDFSHANAYDTMIRPITTLMNGVQQGIEEDQIFKNVFTSMIDATKETASPFVSESIWTEALMDVSPIAGRGGRTREGRRLWTDETPWGDAFAAGIKHLGSTMVPGSGPAFNRMKLALTEEVDEYGRTYEFDDEFAGVFGFRAVEVDPLNSMKFKIADFRTGINDSRREFTGPLLRGGPITPEQVIDQYEIANQSLFRVQQEMFKDYYAARILGVSDKALSNTFQDRVSNKQVRAIRTGRFTPFIPSENIEQAFKDNARAIGEPDAYKIAKDNIRRLVKQYSKLRLGEEFPTLENPFRTSFDQPRPQPSNAFTPSLNNQSLSSVPNMIPGANQQAIIQRGQQVFGPTDTVFGA